MSTAPRSERLPAWTSCAARRTSSSSARPAPGKTGLALGLLCQACLNGYTGRFYKAQALFDELYASLADRTTTKLLRELSRMRPIAIDELGYLSLKPEQVNAFFQLMDQRYGRVSSIITTNLDYPAWYEMFNNKPLVDALLDRLRHQCITIRINGPSLRDPASSPGAEPTPCAHTRREEEATNIQVFSLSLAGSAQFQLRSQPPPDWRHCRIASRGHMHPPPVRRPDHKYMRTWWVRFW